MDTVVYQISDFTTNPEYAEKKKQEGYTVEELIFKDETPYEVILLEGC